jgi:hypothetical protein
MYADHACTATARVLVLDRRSRVAFHHDIDLGEALSPGLAR